MTSIARLFFYFILVWIPIVYPSNSFAQPSTQSAEPIGDEEIDGFSVIKAGESIQKKIKDNLFIKVELSKATCFVGEPVLVTYQLLTRIHAKSTVSETPSFSGCSVLEMTTDDLKATTVLINGKKFRAYVIRKVQLLPLIEGPLSLGTAKVNTDIQFYRDSGKFYAPVFQHLLLSSPAQTITVKPLPAVDSLHHLFDGAIGQFFMTTKVKKPVDTVNGTNFLEIGITGRGNFSSVTCPAIHWPSGIQAFEMQSSDVLNKFNFPVLGVKKFSIPFTCNQQGESVIPSIEFIFFDADSQRYQTAQTDTIHIKVQPPVAYHPPKEDIIIEEEQDYIWIIIPALAIAATIGLIIFFNLQGKKARPPTTNLEEQWPEAITHFVEAPATPSNLEPISVAENSTVAIEQLHQAPNVFLAAKQIAQTMLDDQGKDWDKTKLEEVIATCNAVLYAQANVEPALVINLMQEILRSKA